MTRLLTQNSPRIPSGAETVYEPERFAIDDNTPFNPSIALILLLIASGALAYLLQPKRR